MGLKFYLPLLILLFIYCSTETDVATFEQPPLTDMLTLEMAFGDENVKDEFLLASPQSMDVSENGDIYVLDEDRVKIFDKKGKEKKIIGRPGQGPGEFETPIYIRLSSSGLLTVEEDRRFSVFSPDHSFIEKVRWSTNQQYKKLFPDSKNLFIDRDFTTGKAAALSSTQRIVSLPVREMPDNENMDGLKGYVTDLLAFDDNSVFKEIARYKKVNYIAYAGIDPGFARPLPPFLLGSIKWGILPDNRVVYTHTRFDKNINENGYTYTLYIVSLKNFEKTTITHKYSPVEILSFNAHPGFEKGSVEAKTYINVLKEAKYIGTLGDLLVDRNYIFAFINKYDFFEIDSKTDYLVDIFDADTGRYLNSAYFPFSPSVIKNGYAYRIKQGKDIFPQVERYKIDPAVYGK